MVELGFYGGEIGEDVGVVVFQIVENGGARAVVDEFAAFVKKGGVVFVGFNHEKGRFVLRQAGGNVEVLRDAANQKTRAQARVFQYPRKHGRGGGFTVRARHGKHPMLAQHVFGKPLRPRNIGQIAVENGFHHFHAALGDVANHINIGGELV